MKARVLVLAFSLGCTDPAPPRDEPRELGAHRAEDAPGPGSGHDRESPDGDELALVPEFETASSSRVSFTNEDRDAWERAIPEIEEIEIRSSVDGELQPALYFDPGGDTPRPLLVALHSWSAGYLQSIDIPFGVFARRNGWVFVHPDHRGRNDGPEATNSEAALEDVIDAVEYARERANVDPRRIYLVGYSGGAMAALILAVRRPDLWAGVVAWVPVFDLADWYERSVGRHWQYVREIAASCGGAPDESATAASECRARSPSAHLEAPLEHFGVYIATGIRDPIVPPEHSVSAFNRIAAPEDRLSTRDFDYLQRKRELPPTLAAAMRDGEAASRALYAEAGVEVLLERRSGLSALVLFDGAHDVVYNPALLWLGRQRRE